MLTSELEQSLRENPSKPVPDSGVEKWAKIGGKAVVGVIGGYIFVSVIPPLIWWGVRKLNPRLQAPLRRYAPRHRTIGEGLVIGGLITKNPVIAGLGGGMIINDTDDSVIRKQKWITDKGAEPGKFNMVRYKIPAFLPSHIKYDMIGDVLKEIVTKPTWNETTKEWIPPGREHPEVLKVAREIIEAKGLDGHDKKAVLEALQKWTQKNVKYVYDPRWLDTYVHPHLTLKTRVGDCDDQALLTASMGEALGIPMAFILIAQKQKGHYNHVLSGGVVDKKLHPIETIYPHPFNTISPHIDKKIIPIP